MGDWYDDNADNFLVVPTADATTNEYSRDVIGNKTDAAVTTVGTTKSLMAYLKGVMNDLSNGTDGLGALKDLIDTATTDIGTVDTVVDGLQTDLSNATDGLGALKTLIDAVGVNVAPVEIIENTFDYDMGYWTEVDVGADRVTIDYSSEVIFITDLDQDEDVYVYKATDANVADFILDFEFSMASTTLGNSSFGIGLADGVGTIKDVTNGLYVRFFKGAGTNVYTSIAHMTSGAGSDSTTCTVVDDTTYYGRLIRRGSYCWLGIFSDRIRESHAAGSPVEYRDVTPVEFTHFYPMAAYDDGMTGKEVDAHIHNVKLISAKNIDAYIGRHVL